jgi:hydrogenase maturation protease
MGHTLVIGYGNLDRQDDGVAYHVINALRRRLGQDGLDEEETGLEELGAAIDSIFVAQLAPELLDTAAAYEQTIFVDAHVRTDIGDLYWAPVQPEYASATFTHHMTPALFLALLQALYRREPAGSMVSIRGHRFDFQRGLSAATQAFVEPAAEQILRLTSPTEALAPADGGQNASRGLMQHRKGGQ